MMRYRMHALPEKVDPPDTANTPESIDHLMKRANNCTITLNLYDEDAFIVREIPVPFHLGVDDEQTIIGLNANSSVQMDMQEYRKLITTSPSWSVSWTCRY